MDITLFHNPRCSKSRATLALLREKGYEPEIVHYLDTPLSQDTIRELLSLLGMAPRELMRKNEAPYKELGLDDPSKSEQQLVAALHEHPILIERPIVVAGGSARIGRPPESVLEIL